MSSTLVCSAATTVAHDTEQTSPGVFLTLVKGTLHPECRETFAELPEFRSKRLRPAAEPRPVCGETKRTGARGFPEAHPSLARRAPPFADLFVSSHAASGYYRLPDDIISSALKWWSRNIFLYHVTLQSSFLNTFPMNVGEWAPGYASGLSPALTLLMSAFALLSTSSKSTSHLRRLTERSPTTHTSVNPRLRLLTSPVTSSAQKD